MKKFLNIYSVSLIAVMFFALSLFAWVKAPETYTNTERRALAKLPALKTEQLLSGRFMTDFENYSMDQFPMRDGFRTFKSFVSKYAFFNLDNHDVYVKNGFFSKLEYPLNEKRLDSNIAKINEIYNSFLCASDCKVYLSIIPDKNYYLAVPIKYPSLDYEEFIKTVKAGTSFESFIDVSDKLSIDDFYNTDQHWKQECITDIANIYLREMDSPEIVFDDYETLLLDYPFFGAYVGQMSLPAKADTIRYLYTDSFANVSVEDYSSGVSSEGSIYDMGKAYGRDSYDIFLSGSTPLIIIENPDSYSDKELIVFRDSFGSSLVPLFIESYKKITVIDLRYLKSNQLQNYVTFTNQDVLFVYSTLILNNSIYN